MKVIKICCFLLAALSISSCVPAGKSSQAAACPEWETPADGVIAAFASAKRLDRCLAARLRGMDLAEAGEVRDGVWRRLSERYSPVGWKLALTGAELQKRFGVDRPLLGRLYAPMLNLNRARIPLKSGVRLAMEADLLVEVGDESINEARSLRQVAQSLAMVSAFIEMPDLYFAEGVPPNGSQLLAMNTAARWGVVGQRLLAPAVRSRLTGPVGGILSADEVVEALSDMKVTLRAGGAEVKRVDTKGAEHPLRAALRIRDAARAAGERLKVGDKLSLGSLSGLHPARRGRIEAEYQFADGRKLRVVARVD